MFSKDDHTEDGTEVIGFIGKGMTVEGKLTFDSAVRIDGVFKGEIDAKGMLVVGNDAFIEAEVKVDTLIVTGEINGVVEASKRVEIQAPGKIIGEVRTPNLIIGDGAVIDGNCVMLKRENAGPGANTLEYSAEKHKEHA
jgi:cytoskeletal protein CcmA (bactofilin family)